MDQNLAIFIQKSPEPRFQEWEKSLSKPLRKKLKYIEWEEPPSRPDFWAKIFKR